MSWFLTYLMKNKKVLLLVAPFFYIPKSLKPYKLSFFLKRMFIHEVIDLLGQQQRIHDFRTFVSNQNFPIDKKGAFEKAPFFISLKYNPLNFSLKNA